MSKLTYKSQIVNLTYFLNFIHSVKMIGRIIFLLSLGGNLMKRTKIKNRILRGMIVSSTASAIVISLVSLILMYQTITNNAETTSESTLNSYNGYVSIALDNIADDLEDAANSEYIFDDSITINEIGRAHV